MLVKVPRLLKRAWEPSDLSPGFEDERPAVCTTQACKVPVTNGPRHRNLWQVGEPQDQHSAVSPRGAPSTRTHMHAHHKPLACRDKARLPHRGRGLSYPRPHRPGWRDTDAENNRNASSHCSGGQKSQTKMWAGPWSPQGSSLPPPAASSPGAPWPVAASLQSLLLITWPCPSCPCVLSSDKDPSHWILGPPSSSMTPS